MSQYDLVDVRRNGQPVATIPDPEVRPKAKHRRFTAEYKKRILDEAATCTQRGELGALLCREGLYSSLLNQWRHQQTQGALADSPRRSVVPSPTLRAGVPANKGRTLISHW